VSFITKTDRCSPDVVSFQYNPSIRYSYDIWIEICGKERLDSGQIHDCNPQACVQIKMQAPRLQLVLKFF
jgi:hypothetical protein